MLRDDRKACIELGAGWGREKDPLCENIMADQIVHRFKQGDFSQGILAGVRALDLMARDKPLPTVPRPWWHYALLLGAAGLAVFTVVSLIRSGAGGWSWLFWGVVFSVIGYVLYTILAISNSSGRGGSFGGGSFGGGSSGGGGAFGSW